MRKILIEIFIAVFAGLFVWFITDRILDRLPEYKKSISTFSEVLNFNSFVKSNLNKIIFLDLTLEESPYLKVRDMNNEGLGFNIVTGG